MVHNQSLFYPCLGGVRDLAFLRLSGVGLGNSFFNYFHTYVLSQKHGGRMIHPAWPSFKIGPILRRESRKRFYIGLFRVAGDEIAGVEKLVALAKLGMKANLVSIDEAGASQVSSTGLNLVSSKRFTFCGLNDYRDDIRKRLLEMIRDPLPADFSWGRSDYIGCHVRLGGDFPPAMDVAELNRGVSNRRIPISWYVGVLKRLKNDYPNKRILVVSDGRPDELQDLLALGAELPPTTSDIGDILTLSSASILVGSNSTFSRWAAFFGNMPSVWIAKTDLAKEMCASDIPVSYVPVGSENSPSPIFVDQ
ncbi:hypothetical protein [Bradyrhizobium sp. USDA 223]|uniref:hypothetical protein n=1 Tax=Bradyrhizobium sp. USDA 223 TaxID=3156306 RepID=UPI0038378562